MSASRRSSPRSAKRSVELFPLYVFHPSRHLPPAKVRAFIDFVVASMKGAKRYAP